MEETVVRDEAVKSLEKVANKLDASALLNQFLLMTQRLACSELFTSRISAINLIADLYPKFGTQKESIR